MIGEKNKMIAEFMGLTPCFDNGLNGPIQVGFYMPTKKNIPYCVEYSKLLYDTSWDWLMPVVEKIEASKIDEYYAFSVQIENNYCLIKGNEKNRQPGTIHQSQYGKEYASKIEAVYEGVIEFITFYNDTKQYFANKFANNTPQP